MSRWKRALICLGIVVIVGVYIWAFGPQTILTSMAHYEYRSIPRAAKTPVSLADLSVSSVTHKKISYFGYEFELPWDDVDEQKGRTTGTVHLTVFKSGNAFWFSTFPPRDFVKNVIDKTKLTPEQFRQVYGNEAFDSDYGFMSVMLLTAPQELSPFMSKSRAAALTTLLLFKTISVPEADSGIFSIHAADFQGYQFGDPLIGSSQIRDDLYADDGGVEFIFFQCRGKSPNVSQPEINRILQSLHKTPTASAVSDPN